MSSWSIDRTARLYRLSRWGGEYLRITPEGHLCLLPQPDRPDLRVDVSRLLRDLPGQGRWPVAVHVPAILRHRLDRLSTTLEQAARRQSTPPSWRVIYPLKANPRREVVTTLLDHGNGELGVEVGTRSEWLAALSLPQTRRNWLVCHGYKDEAMMALACRAAQEGQPLVLVLEHVSECRRFLAACPSPPPSLILGLRLRLQEADSGHWRHSGGEQAKFGLSASDLPETVAQLKTAGLLQRLRMLHFHIGSQVAHLSDFRTAARTAARRVDELRRLGAPIAIVDAGGGLGIDYGLARHSTAFDIHYTLEAYADALMGIVANIPGEPVELWIESGRALTAHHAFLLTHTLPGDNPEAGVSRGESPGKNRGKSPGKAMPVPMRFINLSVFRSLPDAWAIHQPFPVMPLVKLDQPPAQRVVLADPTCDSDGRLTHYAVRGRRGTALPLPATGPGESLPLGIFLTGAYQETLGSLHNLFGEPARATLEVTGPDTFEMLDWQPAESVEAVLGRMGYSGVRPAHLDRDEWWQATYGAVKI
ncbi:MAG: hypothetical protein HQL56_01630 [Magnetococcales bacterium]|nr:hypothetical protein [Magnetococcales bacterium]